MGNGGPRRVPGRAALGALADILLLALVAPRCCGCEQPLSRPSLGPVCARCWESVRLIQTPLPLPASSLLDAAWAAAEFEGPFRHILHAFKYQGRRSLARPIGALMRGAAKPASNGASIAVPVPLHPWRRLSRGFNQAHDLARELGLPVVRALTRTRATRPQEHLTAGARWQNVKGAFALASPASAASLRGAIVVLVDDVHTTGATLQGCARVLKAAGAREVRAVTAAVARPHAEN